MDRKLTDSMPVQLSLGLVLRDGESFANYFPGPNREAMQAVRDLTDRSGRFIYLWGATATGKTHLLHAVCRLASEEGATPAYLPLAQARDVSTAWLEGLEHLALVCVDDIQAIAGEPAWEAALFHLYNRVREMRARLIIAGNAAPGDLHLSLPDLSSRLMWGLVFQLHALDDGGKVSALQLRARHRGFELPEEVARFLLRRCPRDMPALFKLLQGLDHISLARQRKLTLPFVREWINASGRGE